MLQLLETSDCPCRRCETRRMVSKRLEVTHPLDELTARLNTITEKVSAIDPEGKDVLLELLTTGECASLRDHWVEAFSNLILLRTYHKVICDALTENGVEPHQIACFAADTCRLENIMLILDQVEV